MAIKIPSVKAPDLTRRSHDINIPAGAFGEPVGAAIGKIGADTADTANKVNIALARMEERRAATQANSAFKNVSINQFAALDAAKQEALKDPALLPGFQAAQTKRYDDEMNAIKQGMDKRTLLRFEALSLPVRTALAKNAITWSREQEVVNGRNQMNAVVDGMVASAVSRIGDSGVLKTDIAKKLVQGQQDGFLLNKKMQQQDVNKEIGKRDRQVDRNIANHLVYGNPQLLLDWIENKTLLPDLTPEDERIFESLARTSLSGIEERARVTTLDSYFHKNVEFSELYHSGQLHGPEGWARINQEVESLQAAVNDGDELANKQQISLMIMRDKLPAPEKVKLQSDIQRKLRDAAATDEMKKIRREEGLEPGVKPTKAQKGIMNTFFTNRYLGLTKKKQQGKNRGQVILADTGTRLSVLLSLMTDAEIALQDESIDPSVHKMITTKLAPIVRKKIESKHFQAASGMFTIDRDADIYSDAFTHVIDTLKGTEFDTPENVSDAIQFAFEIASTTDNMKFDDALERRDRLFKSGGSAMKQLYRKLIPEINNLTDDEMPDHAITTTIGGAETFRIGTDKNGVRAKVFADGSFEVISEGAE